MYGKYCIQCKETTIDYIYFCISMHAKVDRTCHPNIICEKRCKSRAVEQMKEIKAQRTEQEKVGKRKEYGLREDDNPLLDIPADIYE